MSTYQQERAEKDRAAAQRAKKYRYVAAGWDLIDPNPRRPVDGTIVVKTSGGPGSPPNGTMGHCFIADATTGRFLCLVSEASLTRRAAR